MLFTLRSRQEMLRQTRWYAFRLPGNRAETGVPERSHHTCFGATLRALSSHSECNYASVLISAERPGYYRL